QSAPARRRPGTRAAPAANRRASWSCPLVHRSDAAVTDNPLFVPATRKELPAVLQPAEEAVVIGRGQFLPQLRTIHPAHRQHLVAGHRLAGPDLGGEEERA